MRVWGEIGVTINMGDFNSLKFTVGHERICDDDEDAIADAEEAINTFNGEAVARRVEEYRTTIFEEDDNDQEDDSPPPRGNRRTR